VVIVLYGRVSYVPRMGSDLELVPDASSAARNAVMRQICDVADANRAWNYIVSVPQLAAPRSTSELLAGDLDPVARGE
jgi:hypothetical protein